MDFIELSQWGKLLNQYISPVNKNIIHQVVTQEYRSIKNTLKNNCARDNLYFVFMIFVVFNYNFGKLCYLGDTKKRFYWLTISVL